MIQQSPLPPLEKGKISDVYNKDGAKRHHNFRHFRHFSGLSSLGHCDLPCDRAQGGELVEPFVIWNLGFIPTRRA
jgi:hypothetical protein